MPRIYKALTALLAFTGCAGLIITGQLIPLLLIPGAGLIPGYIRFWKDIPPLPKWTIGGLSIATLVLFAIDSLMISGDTFTAVAHLTIIFQAIKSFDLKEPWDHLQVYFMSLLQLIIASELTRSAAFGLIFVIFLIALVTAMVISHFLKEGTLKKIRLRGPVIAISIMTLIMTGFFFISSPRTEGGLWGKSRVKRIKTVGFSDRVDFGSLGEAKLDQTIVMRIEMPAEAAGPLYWRGMTLDYFSGISWRNTLKKRYRIKKDGDMFTLNPFPADRAIIQRIFIEPLDSSVIFGLENIAGVEIASRFMLADSSGSVFMPERYSRRLNYTVYSIRGAPEASYDLFNNYLQLPKNSQRISKFASELTKNLHTPSEKALKIESHLRSAYKYSLFPPLPAKGVSPVDDFLFNSKTGYCEHYATSMALMLRSIGIPSRVVTGFIGGERNEYGGYIIVRQSNAHSWVEAMIDKKWQRFDPTPPAPLSLIPTLFSLYLDALKMKWYEYVVSFTSSDQKRLVEYISTPFIKMPSFPEFRLRAARLLIYVFMSAGIIIMLIFILFRRRTGKYGFVTSGYLRYRNYLTRKGANITSSSTPSDVTKAALRIGKGPEAAELIKLYERARFGGKELSEEEKERYMSLLKQRR